MFQISVTKSDLLVLTRETLTSGAKNAYQVQFRFDDAWENLTKIAVFQAGGQSVHLPLEGDCLCQIPWEVLQTPGEKLSVGVYGTQDGTVVLPTRMGELGPVLFGATLGEAAQDPTADVYSQMLEKASNAEQIALQLQAAAENGEFDGQTGSQGATGAAATLVSQEIAYQVSDSGTIIPSGAWSASVPAAPAGTYLWTRITLTFNSGDPVISYCVGRMGIDGAGAVSTVNSVSPDAQGNVVLSAENVGADPAGSAETARTGAVTEAKAYMNTFCRPNLLDNWHFVNPVNQREVSGTVSTAGYFIDRWKLTEGTVTLSDDGLVLNGTMVQILEFAIGQAATASVLTSAGMADGTYDDTTKTFTITATGATIIAAKLELGTTQTLAHLDAGGNWVLNEVPDNAMQTLRCQRFFYRLKAYWKYISFGFAKSTTEAIFQIPSPVHMRSAPAITTTLANGNMKVRCGSASVLPTEIVCAQTTKNLQQITAVATGLTANEMCILYFGNADRFDFSADL